LDIGEIGIGDSDSCVNKFFENRLKVSLQDEKGGYLLETPHRLEVAAQLELGRFPGGDIHVGLEEF
jgi:hypothetical protein